MIYGRMGQEVSIVRVARIDDVQALEGRKPDKTDCEAVTLGSYVVVRDQGTDRLYHLAYLRADGGSSEVGRAVAAAERVYAAQEGVITLGDATAQLKAWRKARKAEGGYASVESRRCAVRLLAWLDAGREFPEGLSAEILGELRAHANAEEVRP